MLISRNWLQSYFEKELPSAEKIADTLMLHSFEIEGVEEKPEIDDWVIDIDVLPNRAHDCLSHSGIAREYAALTDYEVLSSDRYHYHDLVSQDDTIIPVSIDNPGQCYRYMARVIKNVEVIDSPKWLQDRLTAIGQRPINSIVDATNFVMFDTGNPMHTFDADKVSGGIIVRNAQPGEQMQTLTGEELELIETDLVIADEEGVLALAGVKGGVRAEVTADTKNIILEVANFQPLSTRTTSRRVKILTDSSKRFENGISSEIAPFAMESVSRLVTDLGRQKEVLGPVADVYPAPEKQRTVSVSLQHVNQLLGCDLKTLEIQQIFEQLDYQNSLVDEVFEVHIPFNRSDITIAEDVVEEIGRIYGYHNIPTKSVSDIVFPAQVNNLFYIENYLKNIFIDSGYSELKTYTFVKKGDVEVLNPIASDKKALRKTLAKQIAFALEKNSRFADYFGSDCIRMFEIGTVYTKTGERRLCTFAVQAMSKAARKKYGSSEDQIHDLIQKINSVFSVDISFSLDGGVCSFDISELDSGQNLESYADVLALNSYLGSDRYHSVSVYPYVTRDISFWVSGDLTPDEVLGVIKGSHSEFLKKAHLFDQFEKEGRISYAFSLIFQSNERTLTDEDVARDMSVITESLLAIGSEIR